MYRILILLFVVCSAPVAVAQPPATTVEQPLANEKSTEEGLRFSFKNQDWETVISWFADQTGYSWQKKSDTDWPKGTFTLTDIHGYTPLEALDQLNYALRLQKPPYTIVRNRDQLILTEASRPLQSELIETITPDQLDERGEYEIVRCRFSLGDINVTEVEQDLRSSISPQYQSFAKSLPSTNEFYARETGGVLRKVRDTIVKMTKLKATSLSSYALKFFDPEQFLIVSRPLLGIDEEGYVRDDGSLIITVDPANNRFILKGTPTAVKEFAEIAAVVDVPAQAKVGNRSCHRP